MNGDKKDFEIVSFLAGKTIKAVKGSWLAGGIELIFTDGSRIKIRPYTEHECGYIGYSMKSAPDDSAARHRAPYL